MSHTSASVLHLDLDAFFAAVEQRSKPSLAGRPVVVGGVGGRGVVATCSYEARAYGIRSAMSTAEARRRCPQAAFLAPRMNAYRASSAIVMRLLHDLSPLVEPISIDEAFVDLAAADLSVPAAAALAADVREQIRQQTGGLTASVGIGTSKLIAKVASDACKPNGLLVVPPGAEIALLHPLPVRAMWGVGPVTAEKLTRLGVRTIGDLARLSEPDLIALFGQAAGRNLHALARARDSRPVLADREAKSVSAEETFATDLTDPVRIGREISALADRVARRLTAAGTAGRTVTLKVRRHDFTTLTRSATLPHATQDSRRITALARSLAGEINPDGGLRLLGVGVSGLAAFAQADLFTDQDSPALPAGQDSPAQPPETDPTADGLAGPPAWLPGADIEHAEHGPGWVWGAGLGRVTVRFEGPTTGPGPIRTFTADDPSLAPTPPPPLPPLGG
jgi:DNA polymerase-4